MKNILMLLLLSVLLFGADATIEVVKKVDRLPSIALEDASISYKERIAKHFYKVVLSDLNVLSLFNVESKYKTNSFGAKELIRSDEKLDYILRFRLRKDDKKALICDIKLFNQDRVLLKKSYKIPNSDYYIFLAHTLAYDINTFFGGEDVSWMKKKVIFSRLIAPKKSEIVVADYTLNYIKPIIRGGMNIFPKWSSEKQDAFYYTSLNERKPTLYKFDFKTAKRTKLLASDGMLICSDVDAEAGKLLLTMAPNAQPDIYLFDIKSKKYSRVTKYGGIDVNAQFMEHGDIAFVSNRLGYPNIFKKHLGASAVEQMVYYGKSNSACSAHKEYIVYKARESANSFESNTFNLHLISTKTDFIRRLTVSGVNEFPRFSDDGNAILFIKSYKAQSAIGVIRLHENKNFLFPLKVGKIQSIDW